MWLLFVFVTMTKVAIRMYWTQKRNLCVCVPLVHVNNFKSEKKIRQTVALTFKAYIFPRFSSLAFVANTIFMFDVNAVVCFCVCM